MIDSQLLSANLLIDSLFKFFEWLSFSDFKNDFFLDMIDSSDDDLEHSFNFKFSIVYSKSLMNLLKKKHLNKSLKSSSFDIDNFKLKYLSWCSTLNFVLRRTIEDFFDKNIIDLIFSSSSHLNASINSFFLFERKKRKLFFHTTRSFNVFLNIKSSWIRANRLRIELRKCLNNEIRERKRRSKKSRHKFA